LTNEADDIIYQLLLDNYINKKQAAHLTNFTPQDAIFYGIPKVHKDDVLLRPIVSQINGPTMKN